MRTLTSMLLSLLLIGCMAKVTVDKRPNLALPICQIVDGSSIATNYVIVDQGYKVKYAKFGFNTDIESLSATLTTNKTVSFSLGGLHSNFPTNNFEIKFEDIINLFKLMREATNDVIIIDKGQILKSDF